MTMFGLFSFAANKRIATKIHAFATLLSNECTALGPTAVLDLIDKDRALTKLSEEKTHWGATTVRLSIQDAGLREFEFELSDEVAKVDPTKAPGQFTLMIWGRGAYEGFSCTANIPLGKSKYLVYATRNRAGRSPTAKARSLASMFVSGLGAIDASYAFHR